MAPFGMKFTSDFQNIPLPKGFYSLDESQQNKELDQSAVRYLDSEISEFFPDAWVDTSKTKIGYEIPFTRYFFKFEPLRGIEDIKLNIEDLEANIQTTLKRIV